MTSPVKYQRCFNVAHGQPEVTFGCEHVAAPFSELKRSAAQACKQFSATVFPSPSHVHNSNSPSAGSIDQDTNGKGMESFTPQKGKRMTPHAFRERCQENLSLFLRRKAQQQRGFIHYLAGLLDCSESKAAKLTYGEANPHWTDFLILLDEYPDEVLPAILGPDTADLVARKRKLHKLLKLLEAEL